MHKQNISSEVSLRRVMKSIQEIQQTSRLWWTNLSVRWAWYHSWFHGVNLLVWDQEKILKIWIGA
jgi:hypothetical protein